MNEDNNNQNDQPIEKKQPSDETQPQPKPGKIFEEELKQILEDHKKWVESDGKEGKQAVLIGANLQNAYLFNAILKNANLNQANLKNATLDKSELQYSDLEKVNLVDARLFEANLQNAKLVEANLQNANLHYANLQNANLYKADMQNTALNNVKSLAEANLQYANLEGATGLLGNEFAQADVTGTKLPDDIKEFKALDIVEKTSQNARKIFFAMLLGCVYSWLTIATTTDVRLLTNTASSPLPIIGTEIPIAWFYIAAPLVLICLYFYFHLYLDNLWEGLASLPAIFPDGKRLDQRAYPWLLNTLVRKHFKRLKKRSFIARMKEWITIFLSWWVVPITMIGFWLRYIPRHEWKGTIFHIVLIVLSFAFAIFFYRMCALTLQGEKNSDLDFRLQYSWMKKRNFYRIITACFGLIYLSAVAFTIIGADFREKDISIKPSDYYKIDSPKKRIESVKGANLKGRNLNNADMYKAFLVKADLREVSLNGADLYKANLQQAYFDHTKLQQAIFAEANLQEADLWSANLQKTDLWSANLQKANLGSANLQQANLGFAKLQQAILVEANLQEADLSDAKLQRADLLNANLKQANFIRANLQEANLKISDLREACLGGANVQQADFRAANLQQAYLGHAKLQQAIFAEANLQEADLLSANLQKANLGGTNLQEANLRGADLTGAKYLTIEQLSKVKTLYGAKLDPDLMEQVKKCCPQLLEKPKDEKGQKDETG